MATIGVIIPPRNTNDAKTSGGKLDRERGIHMVSKCFLLTKYLLATKEKIGKFIVEKTSRLYLNQVITINIRNETHRNSVPPDKTRIQHHLRGIPDKMHILNLAP